MAAVAKALGDPVRLQLVDVLRKHAARSACANSCRCSTYRNHVPSSSAVSHHLGVLRGAGIVGSERRGLWAYYYVIPDALEELSRWLS